MRCDAGGVLAVCVPLGFGLAALVIRSGVDVLGVLLAVLR